MSTLSPEQADTVPEVNRANAIKRAVSKVKARKPLTRAEMGLLQSIAYSPGQKGLFLITVAKTVVELAPEPNANGTHDVIARRRFMHEKRPDGSEPGDEEGLKIRKLPAEIHEREFRPDIRKGEYIRKELVREAWPGRCGRVVNLLCSKFEKEFFLFPRLAGLTAPDIQERLTAAIDEVLHDLHDGKDDSLKP